MEEVKRFVKRLIKQTEEDLESEPNRPGEETWTHTMQGQLHAYRLVLGFIEKIEERDTGLH